MIPCFFGQRGRHLVRSGSSSPRLPLPKVPLSPRMRAIRNIPLLNMTRSTLPLLMHPARAAREQHYESRQEQTHHSRQTRPHTSGVVRTASGIVVVDVVLDDGEGSEVCGHDDDGHDECEGGHEGGEEGANEAAAESEEEGDEGEGTGDGMEDHDAGEAFRGVFGGGTEVGVFDSGHDVGGVVADVTT